MVFVVSYLIPTSPHFCRLYSDSQLCTKGHSRGLHCRVWRKKARSPRLIHKYIIHSTTDRRTLPLKRSTQKGYLHTAPERTVCSNLEKSAIQYINYYFTISSPHCERESWLLHWWKEGHRNDVNAKILCLSWIFYEFMNSETQQVKI